MSMSDQDGGRLQHWVDDRPFDPSTKETLTPEQEKFYLASQWQLMWWKFRRHKLAMISGVIQPPSSSWQRCSAGISAARRWG